MSTTFRPTAPDEIDYPETDGEPMAENTVQYDWITTIKGGLDIVFRDEPEVFIAADLFWYPIRYNNTTRRAPDVMVAFGRPKGPRQSYMQWKEAGIAPQVVFEILSPSNRGKELALKFQFYQTHGVEEYYIFDPDDDTLRGWLRGEDQLRPIAAMDGWISPRLGVRFQFVDDELRLYGPDDKPFITVLEREEQTEEQRQRADAQERRADEQERRADEQERLVEEQRRLVDEQRQRAERLAAKLKALGIEPEV